MKAALLALASLLLGWSNAALAQAATCGITGSSTAATAVYDPFKPSSFTATSITLNLTRINGAGGQKTDIVNFFLQSSNSKANGIQLIPRSAVIVGAVTGLNQNIFYNYPGAGPTVAPTSLNPVSPNNFLKLEFTGNNVASDTAQVVFDVIFPPNLDLSATSSLSFNAIFACSTTGNGPPTQQVGSIPNAVVFPVTVLSALRTYYAGTALDFGEIGQVPAVPPAAVRTSPSNYIFVQSSGAYSVTLSSQNAFKLKKPGAATINDEIRYSLKFLGDTRDTSTTGTPGATAINHSCIRAGLATAGQQLPIQATLIDGGQNKNPSPTYSDILTVTITPLAYAIAGTDNCGSFGVP